MDRLDAMTIFLAAVDQGSLTGASRKTGRSASAVSRAIAFLEARVGVLLLHRTTRSIKLTYEGERYALICRKILADLEEGDRQIAGQLPTPRGSLTISSTTFAGVSILRPIVDAFMDIYPTINVRMHLLERPVNLIDEGIDLALSLIRTSDPMVFVEPIGEVRTAIVASPGYLEARAPIIDVEDLTKQKIISISREDANSWSFPPVEGSTVPRSVFFMPRLLIDNIQGAIASAIEGRGVTRLLSCHVAKEVRNGLLRVVLASDEPAPAPVSLVSPFSRLATPKVRAFADFAVPRLRAEFALLARHVGPYVGSCSAHALSARPPLGVKLPEQA